MGNSMNKLELPTSNNGETASMRGCAGGGGGCPPPKGCAPAWPKSGSGETGGMRGCAGGCGNKGRKAFRSAGGGAKVGFENISKSGFSAAKAFKDFLFKNDLQAMLTAFVVGAAFTEMVKALVADLITPFIAAIFAGVDFNDLMFTINNSEFKYGHAINQVITFLVVTTIMFFCFVLPLQKASALMVAKKPEKPDNTKKCIECFEKIDMMAIRCKFCASVQPAQPAPGVATNPMAGDTFHDVV